MREKTKTLSLFDAFLYALMVGAGESYLPAYVISIGLGEVFAGLLSSLPLVSGALLQLFTPRFVRKMGSVKSWVVTMTFIQGLAFIPLIYYSLFYGPRFWVLFLILTLYWGAGFAVGPAWNYWMGRLLTPEEGDRFFAKRARWAQWGVLIGLVLGGLALSRKMEIGPFTSVFGGLFLFAFFSRMISSLIVSIQYFDPGWSRESAPGMLESLKIFAAHPGKRKFFRSLFLFQFAVFISAPFVVPYWLAQLKMNYYDYMIAISSLYIGKIVTTWFVEKHRWNPRKMFTTGCLVISPLPAFWVFANESWLIWLLQFVSGMGWGLVEVGLSLVFFKQLTSQERLPFLTVYNLFNSIAMVTGTVLGSRILAIGQPSFTTYLMVFSLGAVLRLLFYFPLRDSVGKVGHSHDLNP